MLLHRLWTAKPDTMPLLSPRSFLYLSFCGGKHREMRLSLKIQTMGLITPRPQGIEFSWERKRKKLRGSIKILSPKQQRKKGIGMTWKGRDAGGKRRSYSVLGERQKVAAGLRHQLGLCGEEGKHCGVIQQHLQTSPTGNWSKFLKQWGQ